MDSSTTLGSSPISTTSTILSDDEQQFQPKNIKSYDDTDEGGSENEEDEVNPPPFPAKQMLVLMASRICEPIAFISVFPYIYFMIKSFGIDNDHEVAVYAGLVTSMFALAESFSGVFWGSLSDKIGRKPVLLVGMSGTGICMLIFGFSKNIAVAMFARLLGGALNGNIGVIIATMGEMSHGRKQKAKANSIIQFVWSLGSIIGASIGGSFAIPVSNWPGVFRPGSIWEEYPFLLPNLICVVIVCISFSICLLFFRETHETLKNKDDFGLKFGRRIVGFVTWSSIKDLSGKSIDQDERSPLLSGQEVSYQSNLDGFDANADTRGAATAVVPYHNNNGNPPESALTPVSTKLKDIINMPILATIIAHGFLAFHTICLEQLLPIMFATPVSPNPPELPFKFDGGLGLTSQQIGYIFATQAGIQMSCQLILFPFLSEKLGFIRTFRLAAVSFPLYYFCIPYVTVLPKNLQLYGISLIVLFKVVENSLSYPSLSSVIITLSPSNLVAGKIISIYASAASFARAIGPTSIGWVHLMGTNRGYTILSWWVLALVSLVGAFESYMIYFPRKSRRAPAA